MIHGLQKHSGAVFISRGNDSAVPFDQWPIAFRYYALRRKAGDVGLGDILQRDFGNLGGNLFKKFFKKVTRRDCGCNGRKDRLNEKYPLPTR